MKKSSKYLNHSLSLIISVGIMLFVMMVFALSLGFLYVRSRQLVKQEAMERAERALNNTVLRVVSCLDEVEVATANTAWMLDDYMQKDSLLNYTHRMVQLNPHINGCSITMEPGFFGEGTRNFSAYSLRGQDTVMTVVEGDYNYYEKVWYKTPAEKQEDCWVDPYNDFNQGTLSSIPMIASYCQPLYNTRNEFIGVIATDLSIELFTEIVSAYTPYEHSYNFMLASDGTYVVHPDRMKLVKKNIVTVFEKLGQPEVVELGKKMMAGESGNKALVLDKEECMTFYKPIPHTGWSVAIVVPERDIFAGYDRLAVIIIPLLAVGLLLLLFLCWKGVAHFIRPINLLAKSAHHIAQGHFDEHLPQSDRVDVVGRLQNNFINMQEAIDDNLNRIHQMNAALEERNKELKQANQLVREAEERKKKFLQDASLQLRTPLNIIAGFMQVLRDTRDSMPDEEVKSQLDAMKEHTMTMRRMARMILDTSWIETHPTIDVSKEILLNETIQNVIKDFDIPSPHDLKLQFSSTLPETKCMHTNPMYLHRVLRELLYNAKKYSSGEYVALKLEENEAMVRFIIEDKGKGFSEEEQIHMFDLFTKGDAFSQGLGLGLSLCRQVALLMGGTLELDTTYTEGARFILSLPNK